MSDVPTCQIKDCEEPSHAFYNSKKGLCEKHYAQQQQGKLKADGWPKYEQAETD